MTTTTFLFKLQDYFGGQYTNTQAEEVTRWASARSDAQREYVYRYAVQRGETKYRTPPSIKDLDGWLVEIMKTYPELNPHSYNQQVKRDSREITEDAGFDYSAEVGNLMGRVMETVRERKQGVGGSGDAQ